MVIVHSEHFDIQAIADSGQCFRLNRTAENTYSLIADDALLRITKMGDGRYAFHCSAEAYERIWQPYFDLDVDYGRYIRSIPPEDAFLTSAAAFGTGIRILRQDPWEMLITFILSQRKNIPAIKKSVEMLCTRYGQLIDSCSSGRYAFPTAAALASRDDADLSVCGLGYRCKYIRAAANMVANGLLDFACLRQLDDDSLYDALLSVPGVGPKVASCVMLFGFHRIAAFPRDVWINRMIDREYGGRFPLERYAGYAGIIQQYMFYYARMRDKPNG